MKELLDINIDNLSKQELYDLKKRIDTFIKPYNDRLSENYCKINEMHKQDYLNNRKTKNYPILEDLLGKIGDTYKDVIIDLDEFLGRKIYNSIRIYNEVEKACNNYKVNFTYELADTIKDFLINNNIIAPQYEVYCPRCNDRVLVFSSNPKSDTFVEDLKTEFNYCLNIDDVNIYCDNCEEEIDLTEEYNICQSEFYKIIRED